MKIASISSRFKILATAHPTDHPSVTVPSSAVTVISSSVTVLLSSEVDKRTITVTVDEGTVTVGWKMGGL